MQPVNSDLGRLHALAVTAAERAGAFIRSQAGRPGEIRTKAAGDTAASQVVTEVDLESQRLILDTLRDSLNEHGLGLLTEESVDDSSRFEADRFWCVDPLDGTLPFVEGTPGYSVSIALVSRAGEPLIGVVHDPVTAETFHAQKGGGAFVNNRAISREGRATGEPLVWIMDRSLKATPDFAVLRGKMEKVAAVMGCDGLRLVDHAGAALNGCWITRHAPAVYFKFPKPVKGGGSVWDFAATACLLAEWGVSPTDVFGLPLALNPAGSTFMNERGVVYASDPELLRAVEEIHRETRLGK